MKIAIVVHGRFHAFDLARELIQLENKVILITNYPKYWPARFGVPAENVQSNVAHGIVTRLIGYAGKATGQEKLGERFLHEWFGRWAADFIDRNPVDASHCFTGIAEEILRDRQGMQRVRSVVRGSSHIQYQKKILEEEERRAGQKIDKPSQWMVNREIKEYLLADLIVCLSKFAEDSFVHEGISRESLLLNPLGVQAARFGATQEVLAARRERILGGKKLRILTTGTFSLRKGAVDYVDVAERLAGRMEFVFRGDVAPDAKFLQRRAQGKIQFLPRVNQMKLPLDYHGADLFLFCTLEDGYAAVLAQASASGLPVLATTNCGARDFLTEGKDAWIFPIRRSDLMAERLHECDINRSHLAEVAQEAGKPKKGIEWRDRAKALLAGYERFMKKEKK